MIIPKMYDIELISNNYNPDANTSITITAIVTDYNGNPVIGESLTIKHNGTIIGNAVTTNSNGQATVTTTCGSAGTHQFICKSASCVVSVNPYPIGSIFTSVDSTSPATLFGGTWQQLEDTFLYATSGTADTGYQATAGSKDAVVVEHTHTQKPHNHTQNSHSHQLPNSAIVYSSSYSKEIPNGTAKQYGTNTQAKLSTNGATATNQAETAENNSTGVSGENKNMPPYMKVYMWKRTA